MRIDSAQTSRPACVVAAAAIVAVLLAGCGSGGGKSFNATDKAFIQATPPQQRMGAQAGLSEYLNGANKILRSYGQAVLNFNTANIAQARNLAAQAHVKILPASYERVLTLAKKPRAANSPVDPQTEAALKTLGLTPAAVGMNTAFDPALKGKAADQQFLAVSIPLLQGISKMADAELKSGQHKMTKSFATNIKNQATIEIRELQTVKQGT